MNHFNFLQQFNYKSIRNIRLKYIKILVEEFASNEKLLTKENQYKREFPKDWMILENYSSNLFSKIGLNKKNKNSYIDNEIKIEE